MVPLWVFGWVACTVPQSTKPEAQAVEDTQTDAVAGSPADTAAPPVADTSPPPQPVDSGSPDTSAPESPPSMRLTSTPITCEDPDARERDGAMVLFESDGDWSRQRGQENLWSLYAGQGLAVGDFNGDEQLDVFLPNADADQLFMGRADGEWVDESPSRLPVVDDVAVGATPVDIDDDGDIDIFVATMNRPNRMLMNDGTGHFTLSDAVWLTQQQRLSQSSAWGDVDGDGDLDVFVSNYTNWSPAWLEIAPSAPVEPASDSLWLNQGDGRFLNADERIMGFDGASAFTFMGGFWDRDDDGDLDLLVINDFRIEYEWTQPIQYFENDGGHYVSAGADLGLELPTQGMGLGAADMNDDGLIDFAIQANNTFLMYSAERYPYYEMSISSGIIRGPDQSVGWGAELADMDNDGREDLSVAYGFLPPDEVSRETLPNPITSDYVDGIRVDQPNSVYLQNPAGDFVDVAPAWGLDDRGVSRGFVLADFNQDGFLDWMGRDLKGSTRLYLSRCGANSWLSVQLSQPSPNRDAVGAKVTVFAGDKRWVRWVHRGSTNVASGGPTVLHFGLGDVARIDRLEVRWPDGSIGRAEDLAVRQRLLIER